MCNYDRNRAVCCDRAVMVGGTVLCGQCETGGSVLHQDVTVLCGQCETQGSVLHQDVTVLCGDITAVYCDSHTEHSRQGAHKPQRSLMAQLLVRIVTITLL